MSVLKNYSYNILYQITLIILPVISIPYISRIIGTNGIGIYSYTNSIIQYFILFANFGINIYASREIAYFKHDIYQRSKIFTEIVTIQFALTVIILFVFYCYVFFFVNTYINLFLIQSISILSVAFDISWFYIGLENFKKNVIRNLFVKFSSFFLLFVLIKSPDDLWKYILLSVISLFVGQVYMWLGIKAYIKKVQINKLQLLHHIKKAKYFFLIISIGVICVNLNKTLIGLFVNTEELGKYEMAYRLITMSLIIITSLGSVMTPRISAIYVEGKNSKIAEYLKLSLNFSLFFSLFIIPLLFVISANFIQWFLGPQFKGTEFFLILLSPMIILNSLSNLLAYQYMIPSGNEKKYFNSLIFGSIIGSISSILLIYKYSVIGACISVLIIESSILSAHVYQVKNQKILHNIIGVGWHYIVACIPAIFISYFLKFLINIPILLTFLQISISFTIYFSMLLVLRNSFILLIFSKIKSIVIDKLKQNKNYGFKIY